jgi:uncharacterized membrane protein
MSTVMVRRRDRDPLAVSLGWFSLGLGTLQVAAPRLMCKLVGASGNGKSRTLMRLFGLRELASGTGILTQARPTAFLWSRVGGDAIDVAALGLVAARNRKARTALALANVAAVAVPDVYESLFLTRKRGEPAAGMLVRKAVTINLPQDEVERAWHAEHELREKITAAGANASVTAAPGGRGSELAVELVSSPPAGELGGLAQKLTGKDLPTQLADDLRLFKQRLETGEIARSDSTPDGHTLVGHLKQRAAQPAREEVLR